MFCGRDARRKRQRKPLVTLDLILAIMQKRGIQTRGSESLGRRLVNNFANMQINLIGSYNCYLPSGRWGYLSPQFRGKFCFSIPVKDGAHYCYCAHFLRMPRYSRATRKKCATSRIRELVLSPLSLGGSSYFLWKTCIVFQQMKKNFYLPCQFFENRRSMRMLLFVRMIDLTKNFIVKQKSILKNQKLLL